MVQHRNYVYWSESTFFSDFWGTKKLNDVVWITFIFAGSFIDDNLELTDSD